MGSLLDLAVTYATGIVLILLGWAVLIAGSVVLWRWLDQLTSGHLADRERRREGP